MATLPTGGFARASVMPEPGLVDPRLLAIDLSSILRNAGSGLQLAGAYGQLRDAQSARAEQDATRQRRVAANNARNLFLADEAGANSSLLPAETTNRATQLELDTAKGRSALELQPRIANLAGQKLDLDAQQTGFELENEGTRQTLAKGKQALDFADQDLKRGEVDIKKGQQQIDRLAADAARAIQEETTKFVKANPGATADALQAELLKNKRILSSAKAYEDFVAKNPEFEQAGLETQAAELEAKKAVADATVRSGGVTPNQGVVNPQREFTTRSARNLADADKILQFGDLARVNAFQATPQGKAILQSILSTPNNFPVRLTPEQRAYVDQFRAGAATPAPAPAPAAGTPPPGVPPTPQPGAALTPPPSAIAFLRANPQFANAFEAKYGVQSAQFLPPPR